MIDLPVLLTVSNKRKHVALNFEIGIVSGMSDSVTVHRFRVQRSGLRTKKALKTRKSHVE
jgi:hypothetical protein